MTDNLYETLGVDENATKEQIKDAYRAKSKKAHPDKGGSEQEFTQLSLAYRTLSDDAKRAHYDATGNTEKTPFEKVFLQFLQQVAMPIILNCSDPKTTNIIEQIKTQGKSDIKNVKNTIEKEKKGQDRIGKILKRLSVKSGEGLLISMLEATKKDSERNVILLEEQVVNMEKCVEAIGEYVYAFEKEQESPIPKFTLSDALGDYLKEVRQRDTRSGWF